MNKPIYVIGYARISDKIQQKGSSLGNQAEAIEGFAKQNGWILKGEVRKETYTGMTQFRPVYQSILQYIRDNPKQIDFVVIKVIDRMTRAGSREYLEMKEELARLGVGLRDVGGVIRPSVNSLAHRKVSYEWSNISPSKVTEILLAENAGSERANILSRTVDSSIERVQSGYKLRAPNDGYINKKIIDQNGKERVIQVADLERSSFFKFMFEKSAEGVYTDKEIADQINKLGYKTKIKKKWDSSSERVIGYTGGEPMTVKQMQALRKKPIYCGVNIENWGDTEKIRIVTKTQYEGLVSIDLFNRANKGKVFIEELPDRKVKILYNLSPEKIINKRNRFRTDFIFKNVILCPQCKKPLLASYSTGKSGKKFGAYHCDRGHKRYAVSKSDLEQEMMKYLNQVEFLEKYKNILEKVCIAKFREEQKNNNGLQIGVNEKVIELQKKVQETLEALKMTKSERVREDMENEYERLCSELDNVREERNNLEVSEQQLYDFVASAKNLMEHPADMLAKPNNMQEQIASYKMFFEELPTYEEISNGTPKLALAFKLTQANQPKESAMVTH